MSSALISNVVTIIQQMAPDAGEPMYRALQAIARRDWQEAGVALATDGGPVAEWVGHGYTDPAHLVRCLEHRAAGKDTGPKVPVRPVPVATVTDLIRIQRKLNFTGEEMATALGVSRGTITNFRNNRSRIPGAVARILRDLEDEYERDR